MDDWGPEEWAVAWQSAPAHVLEGRRWGGHGDRTAGVRPEPVDRPAGGVPEPVDRPAGGAPQAVAERSSARGDEQRTSPNHAGAARRPPGGRPPRRRPTRRPALARKGRTPASGAGSAGSGENGQGGTDGMDHVDLEQLEVRIRGMAADLAASICEWLHLIEQFDRERGWAEAGLQSCGAWLSWTCSVAPGTAREYVRVARMLPLLPLVDEAFAAGRLSYSKVRLLIQVAAEVDESVLLQQAQVQTVSQFERTVRAYRRTEGWSVQRMRRATWRWDDDGMLVVSARLPPDEGALLIAALECAGDDVAPRPEEQECGAPDDGTSGPGSGDQSSAGDEPSGGDEKTAADGSEADATTPDRAMVRRAMPQPTDDDRRRAALTGANPLGMVGADMLVALAQRALAAGDVDSSGDDRHLLVLHADLDQLIGDEESGDSPSADPFGDRAGEPVDPFADPSNMAAPSQDAADPAGRHSRRRTAARTALPGPRCHLENGPGLDLRTAQRIACDAALVAVLHHVGEGEPLRLGRKTRAISPAQRRALRIRDGGCRIPGCHRRHYLEAHHVQHWSLLGPTDLENLVLLCRFHHMLIHEGGFRVSPSREGGWEFHDSHGALIPVAPALPSADHGGAPPARAADPFGLLPGWAGEPFHLAETVAVLTRFPRAGAS